MSMEFSDVKTAGRMRSIVERIALGVINRERPDVRIGRVHHFDSGLQYAWVLFPGETIDTLVKVRIALDQTPTRDIVTYGDQADVVRVLGKPGNYWITDFVSGLPQSPHLKPGSLIRYGGIGTPDGFLPCLGAEASQTQYPALYAAILTKYGTASAGMFRLPLFHKIYNDIDPITTGLFTAAAGWTLNSQSLRVRAGMVYLSVNVTNTTLQSFGNVDHPNQTMLNGTALMINTYAPDISASTVSQGQIRGASLSTGAVISTTAGVISTGTTLRGDINAAETFTYNFFYPMPDDIPGLNGEVMIIKT